MCTVLGIPDMGIIGPLFSLASLYGTHCPLLPSSCALYPCHPFMSSPVMSHSSHTSPLPSCPTPHTSVWDTSTANMMEFASNNCLYNANIRRLNCVTVDPFGVLCQSSPPWCGWILNGVRCVQVVCSCHPL